MPNTAWGQQRDWSGHFARDAAPAPTESPTTAPSAPALDTSSSTDVPAEDGLDYGRGDNAQEGDEMSRVYETRADREANAGLAEGQPRTRSYSVHRPDGRRGSFTRIHGHENGGQVEERAIGAVDHNGNKKWGR